MIYWIGFFIGIGLVYVIKQRSRIRRLNQKEGEVSSDSLDFEMPLQTKEKKLNSDWQINQAKFYKRKSALWDSQAELEAFHIINDIIGENLIVLPHIGLNELFMPIKDEKYYKNRNKYIAYYHIDFLICTKEAGVPLIAIEIDGMHHKNDEQRIRDAFKDKLLTDNEISIIRIHTVNLNKEYLKRRIIEELNNAKIYCKCGRRMIYKKGKDGMPDFWGCEGFSEHGCREKKSKEFKYIS